MADDKKGRYGIIAQRDGSAELSIPIMAEDDEGMAIFESLEAAKRFTNTNVLCVYSSNIIINLDDPTDVTNY